MTLIEHPGTGVAVRPTKKTGTALIGATLAGLAHPLQVASRCRDEMRETLRHVNDVNLHVGNLPNAKFNHTRMLSRAAVARASHLALFSLFVPPALTTTRPTALQMLTVLFGAVGKGKGDEKLLLTACVEMFSPGADAVGTATGLWRPVSKHPAVLALAVQKLINESVFTPSPSELREAMLEAKRKLVGLADYAERWMELLHNSDRTVFEHDRTAWADAYANVGSDVVCAMQDDAESGDDDEPATPRWAALEELRFTKLAVDDGRTP